MPQQAHAPASRKLLHKGKKFDFELVTVPTPKGELTREVVRHPGAVLVLPVLPDGRLVLIRNRRIAIGDWLYEFPAGTIDRPGEDPADCARRELIEETGYRAERLDPLAVFYTTPGLTDETMHAYIATGLTPVGQALEDDEQIEVHPTPVDRVLAMLDSGQLKDAKSMLALLLALRRGLIPADPSMCTPTEPR